MELSRLHYFYKVARFGGFSQAAKETHISQPSLSKMVKMLEDELGEVLLVRGQRGVTLTPAGNLVFEKCQNIFNEVESIARDVSEIRHELTGDLKVGASDNLCNYLLPSIFQEFLERHPKINIKLFSGSSREIVNELDEDLIEAAVFYTDVKHLKNFEVKPLGFVEFYVVSKAELKFKDLSHTPYIGSRQTDYKKASPAIEMLQGLGVKPKTVFETNNQETQKRMVASGFGFTVVPSHMVEAEIRIGTLNRVALPRKIGATVSLVRKKSKTLSRPIEIFEKHLLSKFSK